MEQCVEGSVKNGAAVGGAMMSLASALVAGAALIGAPVTGGASLVAGAAAVGGITGAAAGPIRAAMGKECE